MKLANDPDWIRFIQYVIDLEHFAKIHGLRTPEQIVGVIPKIEDRMYVSKKRREAGK